jgi:hypothetical protein
MSSEFVLHIRNQKDYRFISFEYRDEIIQMIIYVLFEK